MTIQIENIGTIIYVSSGGINKILNLGDINFHSNPLTSVMRSNKKLLYLSRMHLNILDL